VLIVAGVIWAPVFFFVAGSIPLTALALSAILLGGIALLLARSLPPISPQAAELLMEAGLDNLAGLLEELGVDAKAIYLPSTLAAGKPQALIPLHVNSMKPEIRDSLPQRLIVEFGPHPDDLGLLVATPGTSVSRFLETAPGATSSDLEDALARVLIGALDLATSVQVAQDMNAITVNIAGVQRDSRNLWIYRSLGTPIGSIVATLAAEGVRAPVTIRSEEHTGRNARIRLDVMR